jgi:hypothetical protein
VSDHERRALELLIAETERLRDLASASDNAAIVRWLELTLVAARAQASTSEAPTEAEPVQSLSPYAARTGIARVHAAVTERRVVRQRAVVAALARAGHDATMAARILATLEDVLAVQRAYLARLERDAAWRAASTAPFDRDLEVAVIRPFGARALPFPCRRGGIGWIDPQTNARLEIRPTHWRPWSAPAE